MSQPALQERPQVAEPAPKRRRRWLRWSLVSILIIALLGLLGYPAYVIHSLIHPKHAALGDDPALYGLKPEAITFNSAQDATRLKGWYLAAPQQSDRTVVLAHGYRGTRTNGKTLLPITKALHDHGFNVVMFDFRGSGESDGTVVTLGLNERWDEVAAVRFAQARGAKHIGVLGLSMGAHTSIMAMAEDKDIQAGVIDAAFGDLSAYLQGNLPVWSHLPVLFTPYMLFISRHIYGLDDRKENALAVVAGIAPRPILFIHGDADTSIPMKESQQLFEKANNPADQLWIVHGGKHAQSYQAMPQEYLARITGFFEQNLK